MKTNPALRLKCAAVALSLVMISGFPALAATLTVTNPADSGTGSLRDAISSAAAGDKINFAPSLNGQTITLTSGELLINKNLNIQGPGANQLTVSGNHASRVFHTQTDATLSGLTIANGSAADFGGGIAQDSPLNTLTVTKCVITGNQATGANSLGGGLYLGANLFMSDCTVSQNSAANGGGIYIESNSNNATFPFIIRSTIDHNTASAGGGGIYTRSFPVISNSTVANNAALLGGGVYIDPSSSGGPQFDACTITGNTANPNSGGGIYIATNSDRVALSNVIVAFQQTGGNVVPSGWYDGGGNITTDDPNLNLDPSGLQFNGGPTRTIALLPGSSAIDTGATTLLLDYDNNRFRDQRGADRPIGSNRDIGAYEYNPSSCATVVTNTNDSGAGSLRCAITSAFTGDTITFAPNVGPQINLTSGELLIQKDLTIVGPGAKLLTVSGSSLSRVFHVNAVQVTMSGLTVANGMAAGGGTGSAGGGIFVSSQVSLLRVTGLTLSTCTVSGNQALDNGGYGAGVGSVAGTLAISNCNISNNHVLLQSGAGYYGGGIGYRAADVTIVNTTVSGNTSLYGGGIGSRDTSSHLTITNSTISGNTATLLGGGLYSWSSSSVLGSALVALNSAPSGPDIFTDPVGGGNPTVTSAGYNLVGTAVGYTWINGAGDQLGIANPGLQLDANNQPLLKDNGGPTQTIALIAGGPAVDRGFADASLTTDQRGSGFARVVGAAADVGAFEMQPLPVVTIPGPPTNSTATTNPTPRFYFTVSDPTATTFCSVAGDPFVQSTSPFTSRSLPDGSYSFSVYAKDVAGNAGPTATFAFAIDHLAPVISIPVPPNLTNTNNNHPSFIFTDISAPGTAVTFQCHIDSGSNVPCSSPFTVPTALTDGPHTFTVIGTDAAGNVGQASLSFIVDTIPPTVTITSGPPIGSTNPTPTFGFTTTGGISTQCRVDSGAFVPCTSPYTVPSPLAVGPHIFTVRATDAAGNVGSASCAFTVNAAVVLASIQVTPVNPSIAAGRTQQFTAVGTFSDGTNQDLTSTCTWSSGSASATISNAAGSRGVALGVAAGTSQISAVAGSVSGSTTLTVTAAVLVSIDVTPANPSVTVNATKQFTATGTFSDGTHRDLTATATWSSSSTSVARISSGGTQIGLATGVGAGNTTIAARSGSVSGSTTLTVTPALPSFTISVSPSTVKQGGAVTVTVNYSNPTSTAQALTLKFSLTTPSTKTLMFTVPLTLKANQSGSVSLPVPIAKTTPTGVYSFTLDVFLGATQIGISSAQLTVTK